MSSRFAHVRANGRISFFIRLHKSPYGPRFASLFTHRWTLRLLPWVAVMTHAVMNLDVLSLEVLRDFNYFGYRPRSRIAKLYDGAVFNFLRNLYTISHNNYIFHCPTKVHTGFNFFTFLSILAFFCFCPRHTSHSNRSFDLHFPNNQWYWAFFYMLIGHSYSFFGEMSIQVLCPFSHFWIGFCFVLFCCCCCCF